MRAVSVVCGLFGHPSWLVGSVLCGVSRELQAVYVTDRTGVRGLVVGFCGQPHCCYRPYYPTARFRSPSSYMVSDEPFPDRTLLKPVACPCCANLHKWGLARSPSCDYGQRQTMNHVVDMCPLTKFEGGRNLLHKVDDDTVIWLESTATAALVK